MKAKSKTGLIRGSAGQHVRTKDGRRFTLPVEDYAFWKVPRAELETCYQYECERERARSQRDEILKEAAEVEHLDGGDR